MTNMQSLPSTHQVHCIRTVSPYKVLYFNVSANPGTLFNFCSVKVEATVKEEQVEATVTNDVSVGDWYSVSYDGVLYPGEVVKIEGG
jgi:hypothetical protein